MIKIPTTLVLGAGASMPYGMPSGAELRAVICDDQGLEGQLMDLYNIDEHEIDEFRNAFLRSSVGSIDAFISKREMFTEIGKRTIATILCSKEIQSALFNTENSDHWYKLLWEKLIEDTDNTTAALIRNPIRIITFNYDRSLEFFLHQAIKYTYGVNDSEALKVLKKLNILHVYGSLGDFHYTSLQNARPYSHESSAMSIDIAANSIKIIPEARNGNETFKQARNWLYEAVIIGFLGFGYDPLNVERLGLNDVIATRANSNMDPQTIIASTFKKTDHEIRNIQTSLWNAAPRSVLVFDQNNTMTIRMSGLLG